MPFIPKYTARDSKICFFSTDSTIFKIASDLFHFQIKRDHSSCLTHFESEESRARKSPIFETLSVCRRLSLWIFMLPLILILNSCSNKSDCNETHTKESKVAQVQVLPLSMPEEDYEILKEHSPDILQKISHPTPVTIEDIISLQQLGFTSDILIRVINHTGSHFELTTTDVLRLQAEGVPFKVINYMIRM
jgi:hypothetical protein